MRRVGRVICCDVVALFFLFFILFLVLDSGLVGLVGWLLSWGGFFLGGAFGWFGCGLTSYCKQWFFLCVFISTFIHPCVHG